MRLPWHNSRTSWNRGCAFPKTSASRPGAGSFPPSRVFWLFLAQVLAPDQGCAEVLKAFLPWLALKEGRTASPNTGAYCRARARLRLQDIAQIHTQVAARIQEAPEAQRLWRGRQVKVVDGSSLSMPDTQENQGQYPQPSSQKPGCGFPVMRLVAVFSLATGAMLEVAKGALSTGERTLFRQLWDSFKDGEVVLADTGFCSYAAFYFLRQRGVDCVMRNHQRRKKGLTETKRLGKGDRILEWHKTLCPNWLSKQQWRDVPDRLTVRELTFTVEVPGFRTQEVILATTLLDPKDFPAQSLAQLYGMRWKAELYLRDIKITMSMDVLRCKTPVMVNKELYMHVIAYNLLRALMLDAASKHTADPLRLSLKGACAATRHWAPILAAPGLDHSQRTTLEQALLHTIARDKIPNRPGRTEPRAKKRRPKNYQLLTQPRHLFQEVPHRGKYKMA